MASDVAVLEEIERSDLTICLQLRFTLPERSMDLCGFSTVPLKPKTYDWSDVKTYAQVRHHQTALPLSDFQLVMYANIRMVLMFTTSEASRISWGTL